MSSCARQPKKTTGSIAILGDSWAVGPAPGQPNLSDGFNSLGLPNVLITPGLTTSGDVLTFLQNYINGGGTGAAYSFALISTGGDDMIQGIPATTTQNNLVAIGAACTTLGVRCVIPDVPQIIMNGNKVTMPAKNAAPFYINAENQCANIMILDDQVWQIVQHMPDYAVSYVAPDYENVAYSADVPHYNAAGANAYAAGLWAIYSQLP